ncbi:hypothetical protein K439DRAFT_1623740 [Ramaria rubella]|nr:hypothetical protein K439DRAFT_1623740 [Ramaria rubella]
MKELTAEVSPEKQYIKISKELTQKQHIHLKTNDGLTIAFVLAADTVTEERQKLWEDLEMLAPKFLSNPFDSKDPQYVFPAYHFSVYARYGERGDGAPEGVNPDRIFKAGATRVNIKQRTSYVAREWEENEDAYEAIRPAIDAVLHPLMKELQNIYRIFGQN